MQNKNQQNNLFDTVSSSESKSLTQNKPLAFKIRPTNFDKYYGQEMIFKRFKFLKEPTLKLPSLIIFGPPGSGKTTIAHIIATKHKKEIYSFNAVLGGVADLKKLIARAIDVKKMFQKDPLIFIDEIHRFNKAQQDALLPYVEDGSFTLIGATTEIPQVSVNRALLSRMQIIKLEKHSDKSLIEILKNASLETRHTVSEDIMKAIANLVNGDARVALNYLEIASEQEIKSIQDISKLINLNNNQYDKNGDRHYDVISAFIKSMRGSDVNAALQWMAVMIDGGEDPLFIVRRMMVFASEDIGIADSNALSIACNTLTAVKNIGMPEARINLAHACVYLSKAPKSNVAYTSLDKALEYVRNNSTIEVPTHLRNNHPDKANYKYPHNFENSIVVQDYGAKEKFIEN